MQPPPACRRSPLAAATIASLPLPQRKPRSTGLPFALAAHPALAAAPVVTDTYSCGPAACRPPTCLCAANSPPGGLAPDQVPQFVLISHDNALDAMPYELMMRVLGNKTQPNGCPV